MAGFDENISFDETTHTIFVFAKRDEDYYQYINKHSYFFEKPYSGCEINYFKISNLLRLMNTENLRSGKHLGTYDYAITNEAINDKSLKKLFFEVWLDKIIDNYESIWCPIYQKHYNTVTPKFVLTKEKLSLYKKIISNKKKT